jgi:hypothetical protein
MIGWFRRGAAAAELAADRSDLWPAGALAWLAYAGWLPLLLVLAEPDPNDLAFLGISIYSSGSFPLNAIALAAAVVIVLSGLCAVAAIAEAALQRDAAIAERSTRAPFWQAALTAFTITLAATLPAAGAVTALVAGGIAVAPEVFTSSDLDTPLLLRLAGPLAPYLVALALAVLLGQAFGGMAIRRAVAAPDVPLGAAFASSARLLLRRPSGLGVAFAGMLVDAATILFTFALLRVLWAPIATRLADGQLASPDTVLLLLGFVAIWLALLLVAGALHVAVSAFWAMELAHGGRGVAQ